MPFAFNTDEIIDLTSPEKCTESSPPGIVKTAVNSSEADKQMVYTAGQNKCQGIADDNTEDGLIEVEVIYLARLGEGESADHAIYASESLDLSGSKPETNLATDSLASQSFQTMCELIGVSSEDQDNHDDVKDSTSREPAAHCLDQKVAPTTVKRGRKRKCRTISASNQFLNTENKQHVVESESEVIAVPKQRHRTVSQEAEPVGKKTHKQSKRSRKRTTSNNRHHAQFLDSTPKEILNKAGCGATLAVDVNSMSEKCSIEGDVDIVCNDDDLQSHPPTAFYNQNRRYKCPHCDYILSVNRKERLHVCSVDKSE